MNNKKTFTNEQLKNQLDLNFEKASDLTIRKNAGYGNGFLDGDAASSYYDLRRKWKRLDTILKSGRLHSIEEISGDTLKDFEDTLIDMMNYCNLTLVMIQNTHSQHLIIDSADADRSRDL